MHCGGCAKTIEFTLSRLSGVEWVKADFHTQRIEVETSGQVDLARIVAELSELEYTVKQVADGG
jgi:copper chaperone CopZ